MNRWRACARKTLSNPCCLERTSDVQPLLDASMPEASAVSTSTYNARPHETVHGAPEDVEKQPATEFRVLQDNADRFQHNKELTNRRIKAVEDAGAFRAPTNAARSFNPQYGDVQQLRAVDSMTVRSTEGRGDPAEAGAAGAPGQRQRGGPTDEAGQASSRTLD